MISKLKKPVSILLSLIMVFSVFAIVPLSASAAYWYSDLARGTLIQPGDTFSFEKIGSFKFADYNDPTIIHEVKGSDFSYNQATLSVTDGYYSFGSTKLLPTSVSPGGLLIADYDSTTKMATFGVQNITHSFDETTGTLTIGGSGVVPPNYAFTGSDVYGVVFTQSNLVKHLIIDATDMIAIKQDAFMAYTGGCVLEDVEINSTSSTPLIIERNAVFYESDNTVTLTVNAVELATVSSCPINNYSTPVNLIYNVEQPITFKKNALTDPWSDLTVTFPAGCKIFIPGGPQFTDSRLQEEYDREAEYGYEEFFWRHHSDLVEGTDYVLGDARYEELTPLNASLVVGDNNTALFSAYTITDESVNGTVTASVNGTDVTEAAADADVLLTVAPDNGYQFKSISATYPKNKVEEFSDLVALMGDAVFSAADYAAHPDYTCKVNDGKFVVYDGDTSVAELSKANMTNAELGGTYFSAQCGGLKWSLYFRNGSITDIYVYDSDYNYIFSSVDGSKSTGTLLPAVVNLTTVTEGSQYSLTMPKMPVTVTAEFEEAPAPEPAVASVTVGGTTTEYTDFATAVNNWNSAANGATLTLLADVQMGSPINVSGTRTLDLNGYGIKVTVVNQTVFNVSGNLMLNDSDATKIHKFDPPSGTAGLATLNEESGSLEIHGGYITGFKGVTRSYLFNVSSGGSFTINGGNLIGNEGTQKVSYNGTVVISASGDLTINGGAIIYNKSGYWGTAISAACTLKINGGTIAHNYASQSTAGIYCWYLEMTGGSVTDNVAATTGQSAGITVERHATFSGNPVIKDNTDSTGASNLNVYMQTKCSAISSNLGENACIGITMSNPGVFTDSTDTSFNDPTKFFSDKSNYIVGKNAAGQLLLGVPRTVTWKMDDGSVIDTTTVANGCAPTHDDPTKEADTFNNYTFAGWKNGETTYAPDALPAVTGDTEYTATFTAVPKLFVGNTITLNGDIGVNFFINSAYADFAGAETATVVFTWDNGNCTKVVNLKELTKESNGCYKATCDVVAAHMAHEIHAVVYLNGTALDETETISACRITRISFTKIPKSTIPSTDPKS